MKKIKILFLIVLFFCLSHVMPARAEDFVAPDGGFIKEDIWFSKDKLVEGDKVKIFTAIWNGDKKPISGTVIFYDKDTLLGRKDFTVQPESLSVYSIDWQVTAGEHAISANITNSKIVTSSNQKETIILENNKTDISEQFVPKTIVVSSSKDDKPAASTSATSTENMISSQISKASDFIKANTPESISKPVIETSQVLDAWRRASGDSLDKNKIEAKDNLKKLESASAPKDEKEVKDQSVSFVLKPLQYLKIFFFTLFSFIFNHSVLFYSLSVLVLFFILRFIYRRFFKRDSY